MVNSVNFRDLFDSLERSAKDAEVLKVADGVVIADVVTVAVQVRRLPPSLLLNVRLIDRSETHSILCYYLPTFRSSVL